MFARNHNIDSNGWINDVVITPKCLCSETISVSFQNIAEGRERSVHQHEMWAIIYAIIIYMTNNHASKRTKHLNCYAFSTFQPPEQP